MMTLKIEQRAIRTTAKRSTSQQRGIPHSKEEYLKTSSIIKKFQRTVSHAIEWRMKLKGSLRGIARQSKELSPLNTIL